MARTPLSSQDPRRFQAAVDQRVETLERHTPSTSQLWVYTKQTFSQDSLSVAASGEHEEIINCELFLVVGKLALAGTTTTTVVVKKNGSTIATLSFGSGVTRDTETPGTRILGLSDEITVETTAVGTGAGKLTVTTWFRRRA